jgi:hypothetical protein
MSLKRQSFRQAHDRKSSTGPGRQSVGFARSGDRRELTSGKPGRRRGVAYGRILRGRSATAVVDNMDETMDALRKVEQVQYRRAARIGSRAAVPCHQAVWMPIVRQFHPAIGSRPLGDPRQSNGRREVRNEPGRRPSPLRCRGG